MRSKQRWPARVYREGSEPDPRFTFANERTFLAWIRTSLGLTAAGVAVHSLAEDLDGDLRLVVALGLVLLGLAASAFAFARWMFNERALRRGEPLPGFVVGAVLSVGLLVGGAVVVIELIRSR